MKRHFPLHVHISTLFLTLILIVGGVIGGLVYKISRDILETTASDLSAAVYSRATNLGDPLVVTVVAVVVVVMLLAVNRRLALLVVAVGLFVLTGQSKPTKATNAPAPSTAAQEAVLLAGLQEGSDHIEPRELADRLLGGDPSILLINAGMTPLKPYFTGARIPPSPRVTTCV